MPYTKLSTKNDNKMLNKIKKDFCLHIILSSMYSTGAMERFLSRGVRINKKKFSKNFLLYKSLILGGVRPIFNFPYLNTILRTNTYCH